MMYAGDEHYSDDVTSGHTDDDYPATCTCGSTETVEISDERQSITVCADCGSDEP